MPTAQSCVSASAPNGLARPWHGAVLRNSLPEDRDRLRARSRRTAHREIVPRPRARRRNVPFPPSGCPPRNRAPVRKWFRAARQIAAFVLPESVTSACGSAAAAIAGSASIGPRSAARCIRGRRRALRRQDPRPLHDCATIASLPRGVTGGRSPPQRRREICSRSASANDPPIRPVPRTAMRRKKTVPA